MLLLKHKSFLIPYQLLSSAIKFKKYQAYLNLLAAYCNYQSHLSIGNLNANSIAANRTLSSHLTKNTPQRSIVHHAPTIKPIYPSANGLQKGDKSKVEALLTAVTLGWIISRSSPYQIILLRYQATFGKMDPPKDRKQGQLEKPTPLATQDQPFPLQKEDQIRIVSQYLELNQPQTYEFLQISPEKKDKSSRKDQKTEEQVQQAARTSPAIRRERNVSVFHNFQKHLITTLKTNIRFRKITHHQRSQSSLAAEIWQYFCNSPKISKKFVYCLLVGSISDVPGSKEQKYYEDYLKMVTYFNEYSEQQIKAAQNYLCREIVRQSRRLLDSKEFTTRRMNKPEEFRSYFEEFIAEIEQGKISRRLPKCIKQEIEKTQGSSNEAPSNE